MFRRLDDFCKGMAKGLEVILKNGHPLVLVSDGDIGGLIGIHAYDEAKVSTAVISIDGIALKAFDFIDIGELLETSGAVPVVIKSLVFPTTAAVGKVE
jgi:ethanolamine utilization protein EutA